MKRAWIILLTMAITGAVASCAPPFPKEALDRVEKSVPFKELRENPDRFIGKWVMLGGMILDVKNTNDGTIIEILQHKLDRQGRPMNTDETEGRFMVFSLQFLDAAVYHKGRLLTVIGEVSGQRVRQLGEVEYRYLFLAVKAIHLWPMYSGPQFHIGIGVWHEI